MVKEVCDLVQGQVNTVRSRGGVVSGIVLVGGFGQSDYLYRRMKAHFTSAAPPPYTERPTHASGAGPAAENGSIEVMQPVYAWTAVVRGAVLRGLEGSMVISRKARMHYGTSYATVYDEEKHSVSERYWSPLWERWMVSDRMQWHIAKVSLGPKTLLGASSRTWESQPEHFASAAFAMTSLPSLHHDCLYPSGVPLLRPPAAPGSLLTIFPPGRGDIAPLADRVPLHA